MLGETIGRVIAGLITALILVIIRYVWKKLIKKKYGFLLGKWHCYYLSGNNKILLEQKVEITPGFFGKLKVKIEERTEANYLFEGTASVVENNVYCRLKGVHHPERSFVVLKIPFNRKDLVPSMNGIFCGVSQLNIPAATKIHWSRREKEKSEIRKELGLRKKSIVVKEDTADNQKRLDIKRD